MEAGRILGTLDAEHVGGFKGGIRSYAITEAPSFGLAGFQLGKSFVAEECMRLLAR